jgi:hypothetical protein
VSVTGATISLQPFLHFAFLFKTIFVDYLDLLITVLFFSVSLFGLALDACLKILDLCIAE